MATKDLSDYDREIVTSWQEVTKRSQLTLWMLLSLYESCGDMQQIKERVSGLSKGIISADDKSMYRALRRFEDIELVESRPAKSANGPDKKIFRLTARGQRVLTSYISEYIQVTYLNPKVTKLMKEVVDET